jgi:hypothetical protein
MENNTNILHDNRKLSFCTAAAGLILYCTFLYNFQYFEVFAVFWAPIARVIFTLVVIMLWITLFIILK